MVIYVLVITNTKFLFYLILVFTDSLLSQEIPKLGNNNNCKHFLMKRIVPYCTLYTLQFTNILQLISCK